MAQIAAAAGAPEQSARDMQLLHERLSRFGLSKLDASAENGHGLLQTITSILKSQGNQSVMKENLLLKLKSEIHENSAYYEQLWPQITGLESSSATLEEVLRSYSEPREQQFTVEGIFIPALCNAAELTIVVWEYSNHSGLKMIINTPSRVEPLYDVHILKSWLPKGECYEGLIRPSSQKDLHNEGLTSIEQQLQKENVTDTVIENQLKAVGFHDNFSDFDNAECDLEIEKEMKAQGIELDLETSLESIAQSIATLPKLEMRKAYLYIAYCKRKLKAWKSVKINIGVIGTTGTGKSSFVNCIRGVNADDDDAAKVSAVKECTESLKDYKFPKNKNIVIWDLPGVGTERYQQNHYLKEIEIDKYDAFVIVSNERFTETDTWLAKEIIVRRKAFYFVRTKIQADVDNDKKAHRKTHDPNKLVAQIRQETEERVASLGVEASVYLIDNYEPEQYDFDKLKSDITANLPQSVQQQAMLFSLNAIGDSVIAGKVKKLRQRIMASRFIIRFYAVLFGPKRAAYVAFRKIRFCYEQLGLSAESLFEQSRELGVDYLSLRDIRYMHIPHEVTLEYYEGSPDWRKISYPGFVLNNSLDEMEKAAYALSAFRHKILASSSAASVK